ncbi:MAG: cytochrome c3 family protein [Alphaproteobacteria bacterium]
MVASAVVRRVLPAVRGLLLGAGWVFVVAAGVGFAGDAQAGIAATKHNLGTSGTGTNHLSAGTGEICVFCHTPHGSDSGAAAPLWNKKVSSPSNYTTYTSPTLFNTTTLTGSMSLACLSCHDGTQAMDTVMNAAGSGGYNSAGAAMSGATWTGGNQTGGKMGASVVANLGTDLSNDHPVGMKYRNTDGATTGIQAEFKQSTGSDPLFYVETASTQTGAAANARDKYDLWLFPRYTGGVSDGIPRVECATCHDPHSDNPLFLRVPNSVADGGSASGLCLTCHLK